MLDFLPRDVLIEVLIRLSIKTLVRCACVCKSWYSLLTNPSVITAHLNRSSLANNNNNNLLLLRTRYVGNGVTYSLLHCENDMLHCENDMFFDYGVRELPLKSHRNPYLRIIGSCNGLICLYDDLDNYRKKLYLWNPSIHKTMTLPPLRVKFGSHGTYMHIIGFGFDSLTDDYKVVRIVYLYGGAIAHKTPPEVDIFSLSTGTWRNISHLGLQVHSTIYKRTPQAYLNGAAHWLAYDRRSNSDLIVSFHMGDEIFGEIMVPNSISRDKSVRSVRVSVAKFQESLSLIVGGISGKNTCYCIWVMKEYGISESWTKQFNIHMTGGLLYSLAGFTRNGKVLFRTVSGYLEVYDPELEQITNILIPIHECTDHWDRVLLAAYTESLVLLREKSVKLKKLERERTGL